MTRTEVFEVVRRAILEVLPELPPDMVSPGKSLSDLGANSVDRMEVVIQCMEDLDLKIPLLSFAGVADIEGLVDVLSDHAR